MTEQALQILTHAARDKVKCAITALLYNALLHELFNVNSKLANIKYM